MPYTALDVAAQWAAAGTLPTFAKMGRRQSCTLDYDQAVEHRTGGQGEDSIAFGLLYATGNLNWLIQDGAFLTAINGGARATSGYPGSLPTEFQAQGGTDDDAVIRHQTGCRTNELMLESAVGEALAATITWFASLETDPGTWTLAAALSADPMEWYKADCGIDGSYYTMESISGTLNHGLRGYGSQDPGTTGQLRWVEGFLPGNEAVTASAQIRTPLGVDLTADDPQNTTYDLTSVFTNGTNTLTWTLAGLVATSVPFELGSSDDEIFWAIDFEAPLNADAWDVTVT